MRTTLVLLGLVVAFAAAQTCVKTTQVTTAGNTCDSTNICAGELSCISGKCKFPALEGSTCANDAECLTNPTQPYYNLFCSSGKCVRRYKLAGESCTVAGECASNVCTSGACTALAAGANCNVTSLCGSTTNALFCNTNNVCQATVASGAQCGVIGGTFVQCVPGLACVGSSSTATTGTCTALATNEGATCATFTGAITSAPLCSANAGLSCLPVSGVNKCTKNTLLSVGAKCDSTAAVGATCDPATSVCTNGTCLAYSSISCTTASPALICGTYGNCNCPDATKAGTCQLQQGYSNACIDRSRPLLDCAYTSNSQNILNLCGSLYKSVRCCLRNTVSVPYNTDLTAAYCSSATKASYAFVALIVMIVMML